MTTEPTYTQHWARALQRNVARHLADLRGRPVAYLEVGVFEGRSLRWMFEHVLVHPDSRAVGVDAWAHADGARERARTNLAPYRDRLELVRGQSADVLRGPRFAPESFDLAYVDGEHAAWSVLVDSALVWPLLRIGGVAIWDDYRWRSEPWKRLPAHERPRLALDAVRRALRDQSAVLFRNEQLGLRRTPPPTRAPRTR